MVPIVVFIIGLIFGSFLNAVIYRLHAGQSFVVGRSACPHCRHVLSTLDLIPLVSFVFLGGRCRYCQHKISWQYPLIEAVTALLAVALYYFFLTSGQPLSSFAAPRFWIVALYTLFLIIIFVYDLKYYLILDQVIIPALVVAVFFNLVSGYDWQNLLLGAVVAAGFFSLQYLVSRGAWIGGGDIYLGALMGAMLGWPQILVGLFLAYGIGSLAAVPLLLSGAKKMNSQVPFGTFLTLATFITLLYGPRLLTWYQSLY